MRWLFAVLLMGCDRLCNDTPLSGEPTCGRIEGTWLLKGSDARPRCGAEELSRPLIISSAGSELSGVAGNTVLRGVHYVSGTFELGSFGSNFTIRGKRRPVLGQSDELSGSVTWGGPGQTCDALWDFTARRE